MHQVKPKVFCVTKIDLNAPQANILKINMAIARVKIGNGW